MTRGYINPLSNQPYNFGPASQGRRAFKAGLGRDACPHPIGTNSRVGWLAGWWAENKTAYEAEMDIINPKLEDGRVR